MHKRPEFTHRHPRSHAHTPLTCICVVCSGMLQWLVLQLRFGLCFASVRIISPLQSRCTAFPSLLDCHRCELPHISLLCTAASSRFTALSSRTYTLGDVCNGSLAVSSGSSKIALSAIRCVGHLLSHLPTQAVTSSIRIFCRCCCFCLGIPYKVSASGYLFCAVAWPHQCCNRINQPLS